MTDPNRQTNVHLVGRLDKGVLEALVKKLDCNTYPSEDSKSRLNWLVNHANLVIILPDWKSKDQWLTELAVTLELGKEMRFLHEVLDVEPPAETFAATLVDHLAGLGVSVTFLDVDLFNGV